MKKKRSPNPHLVEALKMIGKTQAEIAARLNVSQGMVSAMFVGEKTPGWKTCLRIEAETAGKKTREQLRPDIFGCSSVVST